MFEFQRGGRTQRLQRRLIECRISGAFLDRGIEQPAVTLYTDLHDYPALGGSGLGRCEISLDPPSLIRSSSISHP